jgi:CheY-like chemotaxis protein
MPEPNTERRRETILVADDDPDTLEIMSDILELEGHPVLRARDGGEALKMAGDSVCLILLDLRMPVMDGREVLEVRRRTPRLARIPVVVLSAYASPRPRDADHVLQKPVNLDQLRRIVRRYCATSSGRGHADATE